MSLVKIQGNASGTGTLTIAAPNTNTDYTLTLPASSGTLVLDGASQSPTFGTVTATALAVNGNNISAVNSLGFRNRIINGDMRIDQRNAGASVTPTDGQYTLDRWRFGLNQASKFSAQQSAVAPTGFTNSLLVTSLSAYSIGVGDLFLTEQRIEGFNFSDLGWGTANAQTVTLSLWVRSSLTGTFGGSLRNADNSRSYPFEYAISAANTWEQKSIIIVGDTTGTWVTNNGTGAQVTFGLGVGSSVSGTAGAWVAGAKLSATGAVSVVGTNGATFYITGVQLEAGSVASPFERRDFGRELILCCRYYQKTFPLTTAPAQNAGNAGCVIAGNTGASGFGVQMVWRFPVRMRATPSTITTYNPAAANANARNFASNVDRTSSLLPFSQNSMDGICYAADNNGTGDATGMAYGLHYSVDAEL